MQGFENSPEAIALKGILRDFFMDILNSLKGAFTGFFEWIKSVELAVPPMLKLFSNSSANILLFTVVLAYILVINIKTYKLFKKDKSLSKTDEERIPEFRLLLNMWLGGAVGGFIGIFKLRHKTQKKTFTLTAKLLLVCHLLLFSFIIGFLGFWAFF